MRDLIEDCVHCGFCLPACPTYGLWQEEMDSPRGRIVLMKELADGAVSPELVTHLDRCLGCMACVTACPSGVKYDSLIVQARAKLPRKRSHRLLLAALTRPGLLRLTVPFLPIARRLPGPFRMAPIIRRRGRQGSDPPRPRGRVGLLLGCVQRAYFGHVNAAAARVLRAEGWEVYAPRKPRCCGSLHLHQGFEPEAEKLARETAEAFAGCDAIVTTSAGCGSGLKEQHIPNVKDVLELLDPQAPRKHLGLRVAYHDACHLLHAQGVGRQPRDLLAPIVTLVEPAGQGSCCGSAGIYNLTQPKAAADLGRARAEALLATDPDVIAAANPGCALQISAHLRSLGRDIPVVHPVELLADALE